MNLSSCTELKHYLPSAEDAKDFYSSLLANCVLNALMAVSTVILNCTAIHAVRKACYLSTSLRTLLLNLAISDLGIGLLSQPFYVVVLSKSLQDNPLGCFAYSVFTSVIIFFTSSSLFGVMAISVDRYLALHLHLRYQALVTRSRVFIGVTLLWILSALLSVIFLLIKPSTFALVFAIIAGVGLFVTSILYFKIYQVRRRHNIQIQQIQPHQELCQTNDAASAEETMTFAKKYAVGVFYVYAVFLLCYLPHAFSLLALVAGIGPHKVMKAVYSYSLSITFLNSSINPVIYCWKMRHVRNALLEMLQNFRHSKNHVENTQVTKSSAKP